MAEQAAASEVGPEWGEEPRAEAPPVNEELRPEEPVATAPEQPEGGRSPEPVTALARLGDAWASVQAEARETLSEIARARGAAEEELLRARQVHAEALAAASAIREQAQRDAAEMLDRARQNIETALRQVTEALDPGSSRS